MLTNRTCCYFVFLLALLLLPTEGTAQYFRDRTLTGVGIFETGGISVLLIDISGDKTQMAACATTGRFAIDSRSAAYKDIVALVMTAYARGEKQVEINARETCHSWGNAQDFFGIKFGSMPW